MERWCIKLVEQYFVTCQELETGAQQGLLFIECFRIRLETEKFEGAASCAYSKYAVVSNKKDH